MELKTKIAGSIALLQSAFLSASEKPNVLFIIVDDLGYHQLAAYGNKSYYETPNIDRLANESMKFSNAYAAAALSSPTRASIMSGKYPAKLKLTDWLNGYAAPANATLSIPDWKKNMDAADIRLPQLMQTNGYRTSLIGKWHCSSNLNGWDEVLRFDGPKNSSECNGVDCHRVKQYTDSAINFLRRNKEKPFFCYLSHNSIHTPELENSALINKYAQKPGSMASGHLNPIQGAMLETLDKYTGILLDSLDRMGLSDNTLVIFTSDNGQHATSQEVSAYSDLRGNKCSHWEGGYREPLLVRWKGKIVAGSLCDKQVISMDFLPTLAELCGFEVPDMATLDGKSFARNLVENPTLPIDRPYLCWHYPHYHPDAEFLGSIRKGDWKLIENFNSSMYHKTGAFELYNLLTDPKESTNLLETNPEKAAELYANLQTWRSETSAQMPRTKNPAYGVGHFLLHTPNTSVKVDNFEIQSGLNEGLQYDGAGTSLPVKTNNELTYYFNVTQAGNYKLKMLYNNAATSIQIKSSSFADKTLQIPTTTIWQSASSDDIQLSAGIHKVTIKVVGTVLNLDKIVLTNENTLLVHDGDAPATAENLRITFEAGESTEFYSFEGSAANQNPTPQIVDNPDMNGINKTQKCLYTRTVKDITISPKVPAWNTNNILINLNSILPITDDNRYFHLLHRKERVLNNWLVYASENGVDFIEIARGATPAANTWFDIVVDMKAKISQVSKIRIHLDGNWSGADNVRYFEPTDFYYDELAFTNSAATRTSITELKNTLADKGLNIFPNPARDYIIIDTQGEISEVEIFNFAGIKVKNGSHNISNKIDIRELADGIYFMKISCNNEVVFCQKFIKQ